MMHHMRGGECHGEALAGANKRKPVGLEEREGMRREGAVPDK